VDFARAAAARRRLAGIEHRVADAERLELGDESVDGVCCRLGYMLMPDPAAAFTETRRVLRLGGRLTFVVWDAARHNPWATVLWDVIERLTDVPRTPPGGPGMFALRDAGLITRLVAGAGLGSVELTTLPMAWEYADFDQLWRVQTALNGSLAQLLPTLEDSAVERLRAAVRDAVAPFATAAGGLSLPGRALGVRARPSGAAG
jgi:SAM-dependent methyltransferase